MIYAFESLTPAAGWLTIPDMHKHLRTLLLVLASTTVAFAQQTTPVGFPVPQPFDMTAQATPACSGAQYATVLLGTVALGLGLIDYVAICPICIALSWSTAQPIIVSNIYWLSNCLGQ